MSNTLVLVDMQNGFLRTDETKELEQRVETLLGRGIFDAVVATRFLNNDNSMHQRMFGWGRLKAESERSIPEGIAKHVDSIEDKYVYSCVNTGFLQRLAQLNGGKYPEKVFVAGVDTDCCVLSTATALFDSNIRPIVLVEYCRSNGGEEQHKAGLACMRRLIGEGQLIDADPRSKADLLAF